MRSRWRIALGVAATLGLLGPWTHSKAVSALTDAGGRRMNRGEHPEAIHFFNLAGLLAPNEIAPRAWRGQCRQALLDLPGAEQDFSRFLDISVTDNDHANAWRARANVLAIKGDSMRALDDLERSINALPTALAYSVRAELFYHLGQGGPALLDVHAGLALLTDRLQHPGPDGLFDLQEVLDPKTREGLGEWARRQTAGLLKLRAVSAALLKASDAPAAEAARWRELEPKKPKGPPIPSRTLRPIEKARLARKFLGKARAAAGPGLRRTYAALQDANRALLLDPALAEAYLERARLTRLLPLLDPAARERAAAQDVRRARALQSRGSYGN